MTAILQPGDRIHLAIPYSPEIKKVSEGTSAAYRKHGITIDILDIVQDLKTPTVVAIFRGPAPTARPAPDNSWAEMGPS